MKPMDIYIANVPFDEKSGSKVRPALVINVGPDSVMVFKITSQYKNKSEIIKKLYYPIKKWYEAGLSKEPYVDTHKLYRISRSWILKQQPIGNLVDSDEIGLFEFIKRSKDK